MGLGSFGVDGVWYVMGSVIRVEGMIVVYGVGFIWC